MMRILMALGAVLALAPAAAAQPSRRWSLVAGRARRTRLTAFISAQMNYGTDGIAHSTMIMSFGDANARGQVIMEITSSWRAPGDGPLREKVTDLDVLRFTMNGEEVETLMRSISERRSYARRAAVRFARVSAKSLTMIDEGRRTHELRALGRSSRFTQRCVVSDGGSPHLGRDGDGRWPGRR